MRLGLVGYGNGGRHFHAPYIVAAPGVELVGIVTRDPDRVAQARADYPAVPVLGSLTDLLASGVDAVTITTPPATRRELVLEAINAGVHVVADKPFASDATGAHEIVAAAKAKGVALNCYQNRRWDADIRTVAAVIKSGELGELSSVESRFDLDEPGGLLAGPHGGLLRDLGAHQIDQLLWLLGPVRSVFALVDWVDLPDGRVDAGYSVELLHASGVRSRAVATKCNRNVEKELRAYGSDGSYIGRSTDGQTAAIFAGKRPLTEGASWGYEPEAAWGTLATAAGHRRVPSERGAYQDFYAQFAAAVRGEAPFPVPGAETIRTIEVLDAARTSALEARVVRIAAADASAAG